MSEIRIYRIPKGAKPFDYLGTQVTNRAHVIIAGDVVVKARPGCGYECGQKVQA